MWKRHSQNRKYISCCSTVRGGPSHGHRHHVHIQRISWNLDMCFWDMQVDRQTNKHTRWLQYFVSLARPPASDCVSGINSLYIFNLILLPVPPFTTQPLRPSLLPPVSPLCSSITPSLFHSPLKTRLFHKSYPRIVSRTCPHRFWASQFLFLVLP